MPYNYLSGVPQPGGVSGLYGGVTDFLGGLLQGIAGNYEQAPAVSQSGVINVMDGNGGGGGVTTINRDRVRRMFEPFSLSGGAGGYRSQNFIAVNPGTGSPTWFGPLGKPLLFSRDMVACRRVRKLAGRARRAVGGR